MLLVAALLACLGAATVGDVFFAFSTFVLKALAQLPAEQGVAAMQRINVVVLNPFFLGVFLGTAVLAAACAVASLLPGHGLSAPLLLAAGVVYAIGSFLVTMAFNVPRSERLGRLESGSPEAMAYWPVYVREWGTWNHLRTAASLVAAALYALALAY